MWDRRFLFSDDRIIEKLKTEFVPVVGNTHELQTGRSAQRDWFMKLAPKVKPDVLNGTTAQGFYTFSAEGAPYGFNNNRSVERVLGLMANATKAYAKPDSKLVLNESEVVAPTGRRPEAGTSVLRIFARVRPSVEGADPSNENVSRDHCWLLKEDVQSLIGTDSLTDAAITRLYRFAFVDNVRGEPDHWKPGEVKTAILDFKRVIEIDGAITYHVSGRFAMSTLGQTRGLEGTLYGRLTIDKNALVVKECRIFSEATAWGRSTYTPGNPPGRFPMVFAIVEAADEASRVVPPQAIFYGQEYLKPKR